MNTSPRAAKNADSLFSIRDDSNSNFEFGGYQPFSKPPPPKPGQEIFDTSSLDSYKASQGSVSSDKNYWEADRPLPEKRSVSRKRETTIISKRTPAADIFGDDLDELKL